MVPAELDVPRTFAYEDEDPEIVTHTLDVPGAFVYEDTFSDVPVVEQEYIVIGGAVQPASDPGP